MEGTKKGRQCCSADSPKRSFQINSNILMAILAILTLTFFHNVLNMHSAFDFICCLAELISCFGIWGMVING